MNTNNTKFFLVNSDGVPEEDFFKMMRQLYTPAQVPSTIQIEHAPEGKPLLLLYYILKVEDIISVAGNIERHIFVKYLNQQVAKPYFLNV